MVTLIGIMGVIFNFLSVYYAVKNSIWTWIHGLFAALITSGLFFNTNMMFSFLFQLLTLLLCVIGVSQWKVDNKENMQELNVNNTIFYLILIGLTIGFILYFIPSNKSHMQFDLLISIISVIATIMLLTHNIFAWLVFVAIDISYVFIALSMKEYDILIVYMVMFALAFYGFMRNFFKYRIISGKKRSIFD